VLPGSNLPATGSILFCPLAATSAAWQQAVEGVRHPSFSRCMLLYHLCEMSCILCALLWTNKVIYWCWNLKADNSWTEVKPSQAAKISNTAHQHGLQPHTTSFNHNWDFNQVNLRFLQPLKLYLSVSQEIGAPGASSTNYNLIYPATPDSEDINLAGILCTMIKRYN
jgi:hypothetical protein